MTSKNCDAGYLRDACDNDATTTLEESELEAAFKMADDGECEAIHDWPRTVVPGGVSTRLILPDVSLPVSTALRLLLEAARYARESGGDIWQFAVEWSELRRLGLTCNDGRRLIDNRLVRQAREVTAVRDKYRRFVPCSNLSLTRNTCFILTPRGERFAREASLFADAGFGGVRREELVAPAAVSNLPVKPTWDRDRRQLRLGMTVIKEFKVPATNQEIVLAVFQEENWPPRIDDPLPRKPDIDPQRRLHDTINSLNRRQRHHLVHFGADGLARGIRWELILPS